MGEASWKTAVISGIITGAGGTMFAALGSPIEAPALRPPQLLVLERNLAADPSLARWHG